jgi:hypothetical protein
MGAHLEAEVPGRNPPIERRDLKIDRRAVRTADQRPRARDCSQPARVIRREGHATGAPASSGGRREEAACAEREPGKRLGAQDL